MRRARVAASAAAPAPPPPPAPLHASPPSRGGGARAECRSMCRVEPFIYDNACTYSIRVVSGSRLEPRPTHSKPRDQDIRRRGAHAHAAGTHTPAARVTADRGQVHGVSRAAAPGRRWLACGRRWKARAVVAGCVAVCPSGQVAGQPGAAASREEGGGGGGDSGGGGGYSSVSAAARPTAAVRPARCCRGPVAAVRPACAREIGTEPREGGDACKGAGGGGGAGAAADAATRARRMPHA